MRSRRVWAVGIVCLVVGVLAGCQQSQRNPIAPMAVASNDSLAGVPRADAASPSAALRPDQVCRGGPGGSPCWTPGERPPTGNQPPPQGLVTVSFTATVSHVPTPIAGGPFAVGQAVSGSFTFDPTATDQDPSATYGSYPAITAFNFSIPAASYSGSAAPAVTRGEIEITNDEDDLRDEYVADMASPEQTVSGPAVAGATLDRLAIVLRDRTTSTFSSDALPVGPLLLSDFAFGHEFFAAFSGAFGTVEMGATLNSLTVVP